MKLNSLILKSASASFLAISTLATCVAGCASPTAHVVAQPSPASATELPSSPLRDAGALSVATATPVVNVPVAPLPPQILTVPLDRGTTAADEALRAGDLAFEKDDFGAATLHYAAAAKLDGAHPGPKVGALRLRVASANVGASYGVAIGNATVRVIAKDLQSLVAAHPGYAPLDAELGKVLLLLGEAERAATHLERAAKALSNHAETSSNWGIALLASGKKEAALIALQRATDLDPKNASRRSNLGTVYLMNGKVEDALREYSTSLSIDPGDAKTWSDYGSTLLSNGSLEKGISAIEKAISIDPKRASFHNNLGYALQTIGKRGEALVAYRRALSIDETLVGAWINLATLLARDPKTRKEARAALERAKKLDASDPRIAANLEELTALEKENASKK